MPQYPVQRHFDDGSEDEGPATVQPTPPKFPADRTDNSYKARESEILTGLARWIGYSLFMAALLAPFLHGLQLVGGALILGHFSGQLNALKQ